MNLKAISDYLSLPVPDTVKRKLVLKEIASDKDAIPYILEILNLEREKNKRVLLDCNALLSKTDLAIRDKSAMKRLTEDNFIQKEIDDFYKNNGLVGHCFKTDQN